MDDGVNMDIETILKETGMTEGELISYVNEMSNQGFTSDEIYKSLMQPVMDKKVETNKQRNLFKQITGISDDSLLGKMMPSVQIPMKTEAQKKADFPQGLDLLSYGVTPKESVVEEEVIDDPDWKHHTDHAGNSKPGDNGWTDLKRFGSWVGNGISDTFKSAADYDNSMNQDLLRDLGMVYKLGLGDNSILQMWNQNEQAELARKQQQEYNDYWKRVELAAEQKEKAAETARAKAAEDKQNAEELKAALAAADSQEAAVMDASKNGFDMTAVPNVLKDKFKQAVDGVASKGGDISKYAPMMKALFPEVDEADTDTDTEEETKPVEQAKPKKTEPAKPTVNVAQLAQERKSIDATKPSVLDEFHISSIKSYNAKAQKFNAVLRKNNVTTVDPLPILSIPTTKPQQKAQEEAMADADKKKAVKAIHDKIAAGTAPTQEEWNQVKSQYDRKSLSAYNGLSDEEKKQYKKAGAWYYKKK